MNQRFYPGSGTLLSSAAMLLLAACASSGSSFGTGVGGSEGNTTGGNGGNASTGTAGGSSTTGSAGDGTVTSGSGGDVTGGGGDATGTGGMGGGSGVGGSVGTGGAGGAGGSAPACPKGAGQICHEFYANDNYNHRINYVNEFTGDVAKGYVIWQAPVYSKQAAGPNEPNSPRTIEIVDNKNAKSGKAILVSLETGYGEYDTTDGSKLVEVTNYTGISGACRIPATGETALGQDNTIIVVAAGGTGARVRNIPIPQGDNLRAINRDPDTGHFWFSKTSIIYEVDDQGLQKWSGNMGAGTKGYAVWWRPGGGAYATTGDPSTVIEMDGTQKILNTVGGKGAMFPILDFFSGFVRLPTGEFIVANWLGHLATPGVTTPHVVEFAIPPKNEIIWSWPDPTKLDKAKLPNQNQSIAHQITNVYVLR